jgi:hypothetical protein
VADSSTNKKRVEEYGVRSIKGRWSEWSMDGNGLECETKERTSGISMEDLAWLIEPHREELVPAPSDQAQSSGAERALEADDGRGYVVTSEHRGIAIGILDGTDFTDGPDDGTEVIARALARAEAYGRESAERAVEGDPWEVLLKHSRDCDEERAGNGPTFCFTHEGDEFPEPASVWVLDSDVSGEGATATEAARDLCTKLGLPVAPVADGDRQALKSATLARMTYLVVSRLLDSFPEHYGKPGHGLLQAAHDAHASMRELWNGAESLVELPPVAPVASPAAEAGTSPLNVRPVVRWFAEQMELALRRNDSKGGWHECDPSDLVDRVREEVEEMAESSNSICDGAELDTILEAADVANMAMMVADHFREGGPSRNQGHDVELRAETGKAQAEWVAVRERLPPPGQWVLCWRPGHHMRMFSHTGWAWRKEDGTVPSHSLEYTHWRPLPEGPSKSTPILQMNYDLAQVRAEPK